MEEIRAALKLDEIEAAKRAWDVVQEPFICANCKFCDECGPKFETIHGGIKVAGARLEALLLASNKGAKAVEIVLEMLAKEAGELAKREKQQDIRELLHRMRVLEYVIAQDKSKLAENKKEIAQHKSSHNRKQSQPQQRK